MKFLSEFLPAPSGFRTADDIKAHVVHSKSFNAETETLDDATVFLLFHTPKQKTWLVATNERVYCVLDDIGTTEPHINWSEPRDGVIRDGRVVWAIAKTDKSPATGVLTFGELKTPWLYSKDLFTGKDVVSEVKAFVRDSFVHPDRAARL